MFLRIIFLLVSFNAMQLPKGLPVISAQSDFVTDRISALPKTVCLANINLLTEKVSHKNILLSTDMSCFEPYFAAKKLCQNHCKRPKLLHLYKISLVKCLGWV